MDFALEPRRVLLRDSIRDFMKKECPSTLVREIDEKGEWPSTHYRQLGELGYLGVPYPEVYDGVGGDTLDTALVVEELAYGMYGLAAAYCHSVVFGGMAVVLGGDEAQKKEFLPAIAEGNKVMCMAITEPDVASGAGYIEAKGTVDGDSLILNGTKAFVSGADTSDYAVTFVRTSGSAESEDGITAVIVPLKGSQGIEIESRRKMGGWPVHTCDVKLTDVAVSRQNILGEVGEAAALMRQIFNLERIMSAAMCSGTCRRALDDDIPYVKQRVQFDQPISKFQAVAHMIGDMLVDAEAIRFMTYRAAWMHAMGKECTREAILAKVHTSEAAYRLIYNGVQVMGGYGYMAEFDMERHYRDLRAHSVFFGTSQIQRDLFADLWIS
ncbi:MAG: acyl-CoA/acyl-ACP dehydrogenase [Chloroflexi bacterium]|nr:acyl-CoA/acyl-ACP dehydrogenase [Chloroflexota bacterium]